MKKFALDVRKGAPVPLEQLERTERDYVPEPRWFRLITEDGETWADLEKRRERMIAAGEATEDDCFIFRIIVDPPPRRD